MKHFVMLEPLDARYTEQRNRYLTTLGKNRMPFDINFIYWDPLTDTIEVGTVLDAYGTHYYKFEQLKKIVVMLRNGEIKSWDEIWFADLWFPWIESIPYMLTLAGIENVRISGVLHAGTRDKDDFTYLNGMKEWARGFEHTILDIVDEVHLGSEYHKKIIVDEMGSRYEHKLKVTWLFFEPVDIMDTAWVHVPTVDEEDMRENLVVFPHRLTPEKKVEKFDKLAERMFGSKWKFVKTMEVTNNKKEYLQLLAKAKYAVSFDGQETFWYSILECMAMGVTPIVFNGKSYTDTVAPKYRRDYFSEIEDTISLELNRTRQDREVIRASAFAHETDKVLKKMFLDDK